MIVKGITIHNSNSLLSAKELYAEMKKNGRTNLCHFLIDDKDTINCWSVENQAMHTGKGYDFGNRFTIAIEICKSQLDLETYLKCEKRAVRKIKSLMKTYNLERKDIYFHIDFDVNTRCPHRILEIYETKERFLNEYKL